jgi:transcriptional antiterminator RfaH
MAAFWSCAQTHPHQEKLALINLRRQLYTAFYPFFLVRNKKGRLVPQAAFPGYIFIQLDELAVNWAPINYTLGIQRLLTQLSKKSEYRMPCKADFVNDLHQMRLMGLDDKRILDDTIPIGTLIRIKNGPFADKEALVQMSSRDRVRVMLQAFNREIILECEAAAVERVARAA